MQPKKSNNRIATFVTAIFSIIASFFVFTPSITHAITHPDGQPAGACKSGLLTSSCASGVDCFNIDSFKTNNIVKSTASNMCLPQKDFQYCIRYDDYPCENQGGLDQCVIVSSVKDPSLYGMTCLTKTLVPQEKNSVDVKCSTCGVYQQCVYVIPNDTNGWPRTRCIDKNQLPPEVIDADGTCQTNAACKPDETCIFNTFEPLKYGFSCVKNDQISESPSCPVATKDELDHIKAGISCGAPNDQKICMYAIRGYKGPKNFKFGYRCINIAQVAGGKFAPSAEVCSSDADCATKNPENPYCIFNPTTKKNQCFNQASIYTDMKTVGNNPPKCGTGADAKDCPCPSDGIPGCAPSPNGPQSVCSLYVGAGGTTKPQLVCINNGNLGTGGATVTDNIKPDVLAQSYQAKAPKLEVDVPGLAFAPNISAEEGPNGIKRFSVPYLATYIEAVYKYALGLGVLIAIILVMVAGMRWMTAFGNAKAISGARTMIGNATLGLALLFGVYSVLYVLNPELTQLRALQILAPKQEVYENTAESDSASTEGQVPGTMSSTPGAPPSSSTADCEESKKLPMNPIAIPYKDKDFFACAIKRKRAVKDISLVIIHEGSTSPQSTADTWIKHSQGLGYQLAAHYVIARNGQIVQIMPEANEGNHTPGGGNGAANKMSIGIDLAIPSCSQSAASCSPNNPQFNCLKYTDEQYVALKNLLQDISSRTKVTYDDDHIVGHCEVCDAKHCDPRGVDWSKLGLSQSKHRDASGNCIKRWYKTGSCPAS